MTSDSSDSAVRPIEQLTIAAAPGLFVILWASGFIGAKLGLPYAQPLTFLFLRMLGAVLLLGAIVLIARPKWSNRETVLDSCVTGVFMHALYLGGVYISIAHGLPAALSALVVGRSPYLPRPSPIACSASRWSLDSGAAYFSVSLACISSFKTGRQRAVLRRLPGEHR
jgi:hypothetical protein